MGSIIENHTDRKEIINLLCILFILGSSFLSYNTVFKKSNIFNRTNFIWLHLFHIY